MSRLFLALTAIVVLGCCTRSAKADKFELADGSTLDCKVIKDEGGVITLRTLKGVEKLAADKVKSRTPGESVVERYDKLKAASEQESVAKAALIAALVDRYQFQKDHLAEFPPEAEIAKENQ